MAPRDGVDIGLPGRLTVQQDGGRLTIVRTWFGAKTVLLTIFALFWNAFLFFWYGMVPASAPSIFFWFPLIHVGVGLVMAYSAVAGWVNRTSVRVGGDEVRVRTGPVPWPGDRTVRGSSIKQLYSKEVVRSGRRGSTSTFEVRAILREGANVKLVGGLESSEQALFLEERIERRLGIADAAVRGEIGR